MKVIHRLVGYDRRTDQMKVRYEIPSDTLAEAKRIAGVASDDPGAAWSYPLSVDQARAIAKLIRARSPIWGPRAIPDELSLFYRCETIVGRPGIPMALFAVEARMDSFLKIGLSRN
jgi:hypothetical protein